MGERHFTAETPARRIATLEDQVRLAKIALDSCKTVRTSGTTYVQSYDGAAVSVALRAIHDGNFVFVDKVRLLEARSGRSAVDCGKALKACGGDVERAHAFLEAPS